MPIILVLGIAATWVVRFPDDLIEYRFDWKCTCGAEACQGKTKNAYPDLKDILDRGQMLKGGKYLPAEKRRSDEETEEVHYRASQIHVRLPAHVRLRPFTIR